MPSLDTYKKILSIKGQDNGDARRYETLKIMDDTWWEDTNSQVAYLYDYYHDDHKTQLKGLDPANDSKKTPIDIKYIISSSQTYAKDVVTYHIQLRPYQNPNVSYYEELFSDRYDSNFPLGLYIDIRDNRGKYNRWMVVANANFYDPFYSTFDILPCEHVFQWMMNGKRMEMAGVLRSQNS